MHHLLSVTCVICICMYPCAFIFPSESESSGRSVVSDCLRPRGLCSPWNSSDQNIGVGSHLLLQGIFPTERPSRGLLHCGRILCRLSYHVVIQQPRALLGLGRRPGPRHSSHCCPAFLCPARRGASY